MIDDLIYFKGRMKKEEPLVYNCLYCTNIVFKDAEFKDEASFVIRCPHCKKSLWLKIKKKIEVETLIQKEVR